MLSYWAYPVGRIARIPSPPPRDRVTRRCDGSRHFGWCRRCTICPWAQCPVALSLPPYSHLAIRCIPRAWSLASVARSVSCPSFLWLPHFAVLVNRMFLSLYLLRLCVILRFSQRGLSPSCFGAPHFWPIWLWFHNFPSPQSLSSRRNGAPA